MSVAAQMKSATHDITQVTLASRFVVPNVDARATDRTSDSSGSYQLVSENPLGSRADSLTDDGWSLVPGPEKEGAAFHCHKITALSPANFFPFRLLQASETTAVVSETELGWH